jgi:hypothetical protein
MKCLVSVIDDNAGLANPAEMAIDPFNYRLQAEGHWVFAGGRRTPQSPRMADHHRQAQSHRLHPQRQ